MATIPFPYDQKIARKAPKSAEFLVISSQLGDTYEQVAPKGLNPVIDLWNITWNGLTLDEKQSLETTLRTGGSWQIYEWTPCYETVPQHFRLTKDGFTVVHVGGNNIFTVTCKLHQVFDFVEAP